MDKTYWNKLPAQQRFNTMSMELDLVKGMTPRQLMNIFPIAKQYDGRGNFKDYFTTMKMIND